MWGEEKSMHSGTPFQSYLWWSCAFWWDDNWCDWRARYIHAYSGSIVGTYFLSYYSLQAWMFRERLPFADSCLAVVPLLEHATTARTSGVPLLGRPIWRLAPFRLGQLERCLLWLHQYANRRSHIHSTQTIPFLGHFILLFLPIRPSNWFTLANCAHYMAIRPVLAVTQWFTGLCLHPTYTDEGLHLYLYLCLVEQ